MRRVYSSLFAVALCAALPALADEWLNARHDPQRTGRSTGHANLTTPTVRWRHYLGGSVRADQILVRDVDADSVTDVVYVAGGKVVAKHADDTILWESELLDIRSFVGVVDLDRDGRTDILALAAHGAVVILAGQSGRVLWELPSALRGETPSARVGDLDGDGRDDLYVGECLVNSVAAVSFSFTEGYAAPRELWRLPPYSDNSCGTFADAIGDVDGDGGNEVLLVNNRDVMRVLNGRTGALEVAVSPPASGPFFNSVVFLRNVDDDPALELIVLNNGYVAVTPPSGARRVALFDYTATPTPAYRMVWEYNAPELATSLVSVEPDGITDLDGDGAPDIALATLDSSTRRWSLQVRNARTGALEATRDNSQLTGVATVGASPRPSLFAQDDSGVLHALSYGGMSLSERFQLTGMAAIRRPDPTLAPRDPSISHTLTAQLDDDASREMLFVQFDPSIPPDSRVATTVVGYDLDGATPRRLGAFTAETGATVLVTDVGENLSRPYEQPVVVSSDGYLQALDRALTSTNRVVGAEFTIPGMHVGGYFSGLGPTVNTPVIGRLDVPAVVVRTSKPSLLRLDARDASLSHPPRVLWEHARAGFPLIADTDGDGMREVVAIDGRDIVAFDAVDGQRERWRAVDAGGPRGSVIGADVLPVHRAGVAGVDLAFARFDTGNLFHPSTLRGTDGAIRWNTFTRLYHSGFMSFSLADLNADGVDDFITSSDAPIVISGASGEVLRTWRENLAYSTQVVADFLGRGEQEIYMNSSPSGDILLGNDGPNALALRGEWTGHASYPCVTMVRCEDTNAIVAGALSTPEVWSIRPREMNTTGTPSSQLIRAHKVLAGGRAFDAVADVPAAVRRGTLSNLTSVADLDGMAHQALLVGSTDGYLYALDPCTLDLRWAMDFRYPVGEPVVGDADGDGTDDVLVSAADGYLYALGARAYAPSSSVRDVDPQASDPNADIDLAETFNTLSARWDAVPSATAYQVVVRSEAGTSLLLPEFTETTATQITLTDLPLRLGGRYHFGVIATGPSGSSAEASSNGVTVVDNAPPTFTLAAMPSRIAPRAGELSSITVTFNDRTGLARTHAEIRRDDGTPVRVVDDTTLARPQGSRTVRFEWDGASEGRTPLPEGLYDLVVTATDVGGHSATDRLSLELIPPAPDAGLVPPTFEATGRDCGCRASTTKRPSAWWISSLLLGLRLRRRKRCATVRPPC